LLVGWLLEAVRLQILLVGALVAAVRGLDLAHLAAPDPLVDGLARHPPARRRRLAPPPRATVLLAEGHVLHTEHVSEGEPAQPVCVRERDKERRLEQL
jgi:hypothetical protein